MLLPLSLTIAARNILRHKGKSLVIGVILFLGALLMTVGNGIISGMDRGIARHIINGFLGDLVVVSDKQKTDNVLLAPMGAAIETITNYARIKPVLAGQAEIDRFLPVGKNLGMTLSDDDSAQPGFAYLLGTDFAAYQKMFPDNLVLMEGRLLHPGERGILVPKHWREQYYTGYDRWIVPEGGKVVEANLSPDAKADLANLRTVDNIVMMGMNAENSSTDVRFPVVGIVRYRALDTFFGHFALTDIESYRECLGYFTAAGQSVPIAPENRTLLELPDENLDDLFSGGDLMVDNQRRTVAMPAGLTVTAEPLTPEAVENGIYNLVFVKLRGNVPADVAQRKIDAALRSADLGVHTVTWKKAAGPIGSMTVIIKGALAMFIGFLFVVAVIIIVNTLSMAALERTSEIGMMRAVGAPKNFVRAMFFGETGMLAAVFGGAGMLLGVIIVNVIPLLHITTTNDLVQLLYGGDYFNPMLKWTDLLITVFELAMVTVIAALYPIRVASQIKPLDAIARD